MIIKKKLLSVICIITMLMTLNTGCGSDGEKSDTAATYQTEKTEAQTEEQTEATEEQTEPQTEITEEPTEQHPLLNGEEVDIFEIVDSYFSQGSEEWLGHTKSELMDAFGDWMKIKNVYYDNGLSNNELQFVLEDTDNIFGGRVKLQNKVPVFVILNFSGDRLFEITFFIGNTPRHPGRSACMTDAENIRDALNASLGEGNESKVVQFGYNWYLDGDITGPEVSMTCGMLTDDWGDIRVTFDNWDYYRSADTPDKSDGHVGDNDGDGDVDEDDFMEEWKGYLDKNMP